MPDGQWSIRELADIFGISPRTINGYVYRGLLPRPSCRSRYAVYSYLHYHRLAEIREAITRGRTSLDDLRDRFDIRTDSHDGS